MGYVVMVGERLSEGMVEAGEELTRRLEDADVPVKASFWFYMPDKDRWRLMVATPEVDKLGIRKTYMKVGKILAEMGQDQPSLTLDDVTVLETDNRLVKLLGKLVKTGSKGKPAALRFKGNTINGQYIDDALIYRMT